MLKELLRWVQAVLAGAAAAGLAWVTGHTTAPSGIDPLLGTVVVSIIVRLAGLLASKIPVPVA